MYNEMNKAQMIDHIASNSEWNKTESGRALETVLSAISEGLRNDGKVRILGFGGFEVKNTKERPGRNPKTGEAFTIKAGKKITFSPSDTLKEKM
jgi:DNA-binding protein HU-beta